MTVLLAMTAGTARTENVKAGKATYDPATGGPMEFTSNSGYDQSFAQTICSALGGSPA